MKRLLLSILFFLFLTLPTFSQSFYRAIKDSVWNEVSTWEEYNFGGALSDDASWDPATDFPQGAGTFVYTDGFQLEITESVSIEALFIDANRANAIKCIPEDNFPFGTSPSVLTITNYLTSTTDYTTQAPPNVSVFEQSSNTIVRFDGSVNPGTSGIIRNWSSNAPFPVLDIDFGSNIRRLNQSISITEELNIQSGTLDLRSGNQIVQDDINSTPILTISSAATLICSGNITGDGSPTSFFNELINNGILNANNYLNFSTVNVENGGVLNVKFSGSNQTQGWWYQNSAPGTFNLNSGTIVYGENLTHNIATIEYGNLTISAQTGAVDKTLISGGNLVVNGTLTIATDNVNFLSDNSNPIELRGNVTNRTNWITTQQVNFAGSSNQIINGSLPITFGEEFRIDKPSGSVTLQLVDQTINSDLRILQGTFRPLARTVTLAGNIINDGTIEATQNGTGGFVFDGTTEISGTGTTQFRNITINNGSSLTQELGGEFHVTTNFTNNGTFTHNDGQVRFTQSGSKSISGSSTTTFWDLAAEGGSLSIDGTVDLENVMSFAGNPTIDFDGGGSGVFTVKSTQTQDGSIGNIGSASLTGELTVERAIYQSRASDGRGFHNVAFPVSGVTVAEIQQDILVTGPFTGADTGTAGDGNASIFSINEGAAGDFGNTYQAFPAATGSNAESFDPTRGYFIFTYENNVPGLLTARGTAITGDFNPSLTHTNNGIDEDDEGWHMVPNPYVSTISWDAVDKTNTESDAWVWDVANQAFTALVDGLGNNIAQGQSFFVKALDGGASSVLIQEADKVAGTQAVFYRSEPSPILKIGLDDGSYTDYSYVGFKEGASMNYAGQEDASRLFNTNETLSSLTADDKVVKINRIGLSNDDLCSRSIRLNLEQMNVNDTYDLTFEGLNTVNNSNFTLLDKYLNDEVVITEGMRYEFNINNEAASKGSNRFELVINNNQPSQISTVSESICPQQNATILLENTDSFATYLVIKGSEVVASVRGTGSDVSVEIANDLLTTSNDFAIQAFVTGCDTVSVGAARVKMYSAITTDNQVIGSSICSSDAEAAFELSTQVGTTYYILNSQDTVQTVTGTGGMQQSNISSSNLNAGLNEFLIGVSKDGCQFDTLNQRLEIRLEEFAIDQTIAFETTDICSENAASIDFVGQQGVLYEVYQNGSLITSATATGASQSIAITNENLVTGDNVFSILATAGECAQYEFTDNILIRVEESIITELDVLSENTCEGLLATATIANAQSGKTYTLLKSDDVIMTSTAIADGELTFEIDSSNLTAGINEFDILIEAGNCASQMSNQSLTIEYVESAVITPIADYTICVNERIDIELSANVEMSQYQLFLGEELITELSGGTIAISPEKTSTYSLKGTARLGCEASVVNFTVEVIDLSKPSILVSGNILESSIEGDSYQWYLNDELLPSETGKLLVVNKSGNYKVEVTRESCNVLSDSFSFTEEILSVDNALRNSLSFYPNPVTDKMFIELNDIDSVNITIFTVNGNFVDSFEKDEKKTEIDMSKYSKGTYLIQFETVKGSFTKRLIKQ